jgi:murein DD-endopeptidase MepM/ murein hydrolase activator NlpD
MDAFRALRARWAPLLLRGPHRAPFAGGTPLVALALILILSGPGCSAPTAELLPATATPTLLPSPTHTATNTPTAIPTATATAIPTATPTATVTPTPTRTPEPLSLRVQLVDPQIAQGMTGMVRVTSSRPSSLRGILDGRAIAFGSDEGLEHIAIIAVHALAPIGQQELTVIALAEDGAEIRLDTELTVLPHEFAEERLTFSPEVSRLLAPEYTQPEQQKIQEIYATVSPAKLWEGLWIWPREGRITSEFGTRRSYGGPVTSYHAGVDISGATGDEVVASAAGVVALAEALHVRGNTVILDHGWGVLSGYYHLDSIAVQPGDVVTPGQVIGTVGATGLVTGAHLHWELRIGDIAVDPRQWLAREFPGPAE